LAVLIGVALPPFRIFAGGFLYRHRQRNTFGLSLIYYTISEIASQAVGLLLAIIMWTGGDSPTSNLPDGKFSQAAARDARLSNLWLENSPNAARFSSSRKPSSWLASGHNIGLLPVIIIVVFVGKS